MTTHDAHRSIGDVLNELHGEFPDITISKIRYLESYGLIAPERTPSGYRKFFPRDVERLRWILHEQKDNFLPLKVIKDRLEDMDARGVASFDEEPATDPAEREGAVQSLFATVRREAAQLDAQRIAEDVAREADGGGADHDDLGGVGTGVSLARAELAHAAGLDDEQLAELEAYGLVEPVVATGDRVLFGEEALTIARAAGGFAAYGIEARHLRMYKAFVERELTLFEQVLIGFRRQRNPQAREMGEAARRELAGLGRRVRAGLLAQTTRTSHLAE